LRKIGLLVGALSLLLTVPVLGQATGSTQGTISGTVTGPDGANVPGVTVTAKSASLQGERVTVTATNGSYVLRGLPPGDYEVSYSLEGMSTAVQQVKVEANAVATANLQMQVVAVEETIVVQAQSVAALDNSTVGGNYEAEELDKMPVVRSLFGIATLSPGVTTTGTEVAGQIAINGGFNFDSIWLVDGVDVSDSVFSNGSPLFIEEALEEQQVLTSGVSAEYGRFTGGLVHAITKSGGNQFQGSVRMDMDNPEWRDETPREDDAGIERIDNRNETYTATLGGYFVKDRLWFFGAFRDRDVETQSTLTRTGLPLAQPTNEDRWEGKLTGNINDRHSLQATYLDRDFSVVRGSLANSMTYDMVVSSVQPWELAVGRYSGVLTDRLFLEAQYSEKEETLASEPAAGGTSTDIHDSPFRSVALNPTGSYNGIYFDPNDPDRRDNEQAAVSLSYFLDTAGAGSHDIKVGYEDFTNTNISGNSQSPTDWVFFSDPLVDSAGNVVLIDGKAQPVFIPNTFQTYGVFFQAIRGAQLDLQVQSLFVNDRWQLGEHWSFNIGGRYEQVSSDTNAGSDPVDTDAISPRLGVAYDLNGDGKYIFDVTYGQYTGGYGFGGNSFDAVTNVGNPSYVYGPYVGPAGTGVDFAPGFNPNNYVLYLGSDPKGSAAFRDDVSSPEVDEWTGSFGYRLPRNGWVKVTYVNRETSNFIEDITDITNGTTIIDVSGVQTEVTNKIYDNSDVPTREYEGFVLQSRYNFTSRWFAEGSWTYQIKNEGNYEGESGQGFGPSSYLDFVPLLDERNFPFGRLDDYQETKVRLWTIYTQPLGRFGDLSFSLLGNYDTGSAYSYSTTVGRSSVQTAMNPGYPDLFGTQTIFYGERGAETFDDYWSGDFAMIYEVPIWKRLDVFIKGEVFNFTNEDSLISHNITVSPDPTSPLDSLGRRTGFRKSANFGRPVSDASFVIPREYKFSVGFRF
jgi:hypothetical protein